MIRQALRSGAMYAARALVLPELAQLLAFRGAPPVTTWGELEEMLLYLVRIEDGHLEMDAELRKVARELAEELQAKEILERSTREALGRHTDLVADLRGKLEAAKAQAANWEAAEGKAVECNQDLQEELKAAWNALPAMVGMDRSLPGAIAQLYAQLGTMRLERDGARQELASMRAAEERRQAMIEAPAGTPLCLVASPERPR